MAMKQDFFFLSKVEISLYNINATSTAEIYCVYDELTIAITDLDNISENIIVNDMNNKGGPMGSE